MSTPPEPRHRFLGVDYDVVIAGGGLAGLCLAKQLRDADPALAILVLDRTRSPLPVAAFKVGESTVEVGAHYFSHVLGLRDYLECEHLEKLGLRYFYGGSGGLSTEPEFGVAQFLPAKSYQLDRGAMEQHLRAVVAGAGAVLHRGEFWYGLPVRRALPGGCDHHAAPAVRLTALAIPGRPYAAGRDGRHGGSAWTGSWTLYPPNDQTRVRVHAGP